MSVLPQVIHVCKAESLPCRQGWSTKEGSRCRGTPGTDGGLCAAVRWHKGLRFHVFVLRLHMVGQPGNREMGGSIIQTELGSIIKTMHLTLLAGDTAEISLLALKLTESCPLPSVLSPFPSDRVLHLGIGHSMGCRNSGTARFQGTKLSLVTGTR